MISYVDMKKTDQSLNISDVINRITGQSAYDGFAINEEVIKV